MSITYEWKITGFKKQDDPSAELNDIIVQTYWECIGTNDDGLTGRFKGATPFEPDQVDPNNFTTYENLTEAQVLSWVQEVVQERPTYWEHIKQQIDKQINEQITTVTEVRDQQLPWANTTNTTTE